MSITLSIAFVAGLVSFLSPCVLPLIPGYVSYISGTSLDKIKYKKKNLVVIKPIFFTLAFSFAFSSKDLANSSLSSSTKLFPTDNPLAL